MPKKIFRGAQGWYLAVEDEQGFHHQPPSWDSGAYHRTRRQAESVLALDGATYSCACGADWTAGELAGRDTCPQCRLRLR